MKELAIFTKAMIRERRDILLSILGGFAAGLAGVGLFAASGYLIAQTVFAPPLYTLIMLTSLVKILGLVRAASRYGERLFSHRATFSLLGRLRTAFFSKLVPLTPGILNRTRSGELLARIVGDVESLQFYFLRVAYPPVMVVMVFLATMLFTAAFSIWAALLLLAGMLMAAFGVPALVMIGQRRVHGAVKRKRAAFSTDVTEMLFGFRDLKLYGRLNQREEELQQVSADLAASQRDDALRLLRGQALHTFLTFIISWGMLVLGAYLIVNGSLSGVFLAMLVMVSNTVFEEAAPMATLPAYKQDSEYAAKRLTDTVLSAEKQQPELPANRRSIDDEAVSVSFDEVCFQYDDEWRPALQDISLHLPAGSKTAIVGPSGSGKTSLFELLLKLRKPNRGEIRLNDIPLQELEEEHVWSKCNTVLQHGHFFRGTIRDNLLTEQTCFEDEELSFVLDQVQLKDKKLNDHVLEKGENLSDGEKQRLALARAVLHGGRLWLLDEPTSSLDYITERKVLRYVLDQAAGDTLLLISHRLAGLEHMDRIIVIEQGRIVESGTYEELVALKGYFYELKEIELQMFEASNK
ncbi:thiol reductant ABC exporter subunit CydC [Paenibacillus lemnae]|uniref:Thiol reductant ABC exporter subunit CydC n=1 Tax=Paenibacillus lemnae TaxID=1330551 RepID=A0A848M6Y0_PAELE|nr:thiol reductant ABC exporter subunit CydC [Paenibacillus lemnae]NMO96465.1 thiol reductant ABC exporter subunit CydC [Paenibacillus lemnae]